MRPVARAELHHGPVDVGLHGGRAEHQASRDVVVGQPHTEPAELVRAVRVVASGEALLSPSVTRRLISEFADRAKAPPPATSMEVLTERERQLVGLVGEGLSNDDIAGRLVLSPATVKTHVNRAMMKLGARDRAHLVVFAYEAGLVRPGWAS